MLVEIIEKFKQEPKFLLDGGHNYINIQSKLDKTKSIQLPRITRLFLGDNAESLMLNFFELGEVWYLNSILYDKFTNGYVLMYWVEP